MEAKDASWPMAAPPETALRSRKMSGGGAIALEESAALEAAWAAEGGESLWFWLGSSFDSGVSFTFSIGVPGPSVGLSRSGLGRAGAGLGGLLGWFSGGGAEAGGRRGGGGVGGKLAIAHGQGVVLFSVLAAEGWVGPIDDLAGGRGITIALQGSSGVGLIDFFEAGGVRKLRLHGGCHGRRGEALNF